MNRASHKKHIYYYVKKLRDGRSYMTRRVDAMQDQTLIFTATVSFQLPEPSQPQFYAPPPIIGATGTFKLMKFMPDGHSNLPTEVLLPDMCQPGSERYLKALEHTPKEAILHKYLTKYTNDQQNLPVEFRPAVPTVFDENGHIQYGTKLAYWLRARGHSPGSVNDQRAVLGFHIDQFMLGNMLANLREGPPSMMASLDHTMWFHNDFDMSNWLLMVVENQAASNGRALIMARVYRGDGVLVAIVVCTRWLTVRSKKVLFVSPQAVCRKVGRSCLENEVLVWRRGVLLAASMSYVVPVLDHVPSYDEFYVGSTFLIWTA